MKQDLRQTVKSLSARVDYLSNQVTELCERIRELDNDKGKIVRDKQSGYTNWTGAYEDYLKTDHWKATRTRIMKKNNGRCSICRNKATVVHHHSYRHLGDERDYELSPLCDKHHDYLHR